MKGQWTIDFARKWWPLLTAGSFFRFLRAHRAQAREGGGPKRLVSLEFRQPVSMRLTIRLGGSDHYTVDEVIQDRVYEKACDLRACKTVIDLGANIGAASRYIAARYPGCSIVAVEPVASNLELLRLNLQDLMAEGKCRIFEAAVWERDVENLQIREPDAESIAFQVEEHTHDRGKGELLRGMSMNSILEESGFGEVDLLKVDVEGAEVQLFSGSLEWLRRVHGMAIEFHGTSRQDSGFDAIMKREGFQVSQSNAHTVLAWRP